jgi:DNA-binding winged helix-turn-helix (wHTH) protein
MLGPTDPSLLQCLLSHSQEVHRMSTLLDDVATNTSSSPAQRLRTTMAAVRVSLSWFGVRKTLTPEQNA